MIELNKIYNEDCLDTMARMPDGYIDLTVTSPPYDNLRDYKFENIEKAWNLEKFKAIARELYRVTKQGGVVVWVVGDATINGSETGTSFRQALYFKEECGFNLHDTMIYQKRGTGACGSNLAYWQGFEYMFIFSKEKPTHIKRIADGKNKMVGLKSPGRFRIGGNKEKKHETNEMGIRTNIWEYNIGFTDYSDKTNHPAPFPEALAKDHIISWSNEGALIYDPFMGSGTTAKMAVLLNRKYIGSEISAEYCRIAEQRLKETKCDLFLHAST